nr:hypothetical protein [Tanacetum cinerariifolium]
YRLNPRYAIKECSSCGALYTGDFCCSKGNVEDKILVPELLENYARCARCRHLVDGLYCQGCALLRKKLEEDLVTYFQDFQNTFESSDDSTNVVNTPREPFVVKQDHGVNSSQNPPHINECCYECGDALNGIFCQQFTCKSGGKGAHIGYNCPPKNSLNDSLSISETSSQSPSNINHCCYECGDPLDDIFCKRCTCKFCGKDAHIGYNCPSKVPVISNPEPCNNQKIDELPQALPIFHPTFHSEAESPFTMDSTPTYVDESPNVFNPPLQSPVYPCEFYGNDAYYGNYCIPQAPFIYPESCYNQDFNFSQNFQNVPQQYPCCDDYGVTHDAYQCQPINEVYYYGQNSCYDSTSIGFDQSQPQQYTIDHPIFNAHNDYLDSQIQFNSTLAKIKDQMTSITSLCEMACQVVHKKLEEKQLEEERAAKAKYWKLSVCYDDEDDEERSDSLDDNIISGLPSFFAITPDEPVLSIEEPDNSLSMGDEHLDTILILEHACDVPFHDNSPPLDVSKDTIEDFSDSEVMEIVIPKVGGIKASNDNPIPFYDLINSGTPPNLTPSGESDFFLEVDAFLAIEDEFTSSQFPKSPCFATLLLDEFADELTLLKSIPPGIDETGCDFEEDIRLIEKLLYDNSSSRPPKEFVSVNSDAASESFSPSPILVKD